ncbi:MAG TPA: hypothetical protein VFQ88_05895 [Nevskiaceae bacterium]|nr:hypothetical protein [Nevskiaceae bacterium]
MNLLKILVAGIVAAAIVYAYLNWVAPIKKAPQTAAAAGLATAAVTPTTPPSGAAATPDSTPHAASTASQGATAAPTRAASAMAGQAAHTATTATVAAAGSPAPAVATAKVAAASTASSAAPATPLKSLNQIAGQTARAANSAAHTAKKTAEQAASKTRQAGQTALASLNQISTATPPAPQHPAAPKLSNEVHAHRPAVPHKPATLSPSRPAEPTLHVTPRHGGEIPSPPLPAGAVAAPSRPLPPTPAARRSRAVAHPVAHPSRPTVWWMPNATSGFALTFAGEAGYTQAIVLLFSQPVDAASVAAIKVATAHGAPVKGRWQTSPDNPAMLVFATASGHYQVTVPASVKDVQGATLGERRSGLVIVH